MASSQVEIASSSSSSPFGCVLRDHNANGGNNRFSSAAAASPKSPSPSPNFHKNLHHLVSCISSVSSPSGPSPPAADDQNNNPTANTNLRCITDNRSKYSNKRTTNDSSTPSLNRWQQAKNNLHRFYSPASAMQPQNKEASTIHQKQKQTHQDADLLLLQSSRTSSSLSSSSSSSSPSSSPSSTITTLTIETENSRNLGGAQDQNSKPPNVGASSLVQMWEARLNHPGGELRLNRSNSNDTNNNNNNNNNNNGKAAAAAGGGGVSRTSSGSPSAAEASSKHSDILRAHSTSFAAFSNDDCFIVDWEQTAQSAPSSVHSRNSDAGGEREGVRIADIIKRLTSDASNDHHEQHGNNAGAAAAVDSPRSRNSPSSSSTDQAVSEQRAAFLQGMSSPRIRGRQALHDLLLQLQKERQRELHSLGERQPVSRFPQRGRIQSLLRLRFLQRGTAIQNHQQHQRPHSTRSITQPLPLPNRSQQGSTIICLRERFGTGGEQAAAPAPQTETGNPKSPRDTAESSSNNLNVGSSSTRNRPNENSYRRGTPMTDQNAPSVDNSVPPRSKAQAEVTDDGNHQATCTSTQQNPTPGVAEKSISHRSKAPESVNEDTHNQEASTSTSANKPQKITNKAEEPVSQRKKCENVTADALRQESSTSSSKLQSEIPVEMSVSHKCKVFEDACTKKVSDDVTEEAHHQESSTSKQRQNRTASRVDKSMSHRIKVGDEETHHQEVYSTSDEQLSKALAENLVSHSHGSEVREDVIEDTRHKEISASEEQNTLSVKSSVSVSHTSKVQEDVIQCSRPQEETSTPNEHKEAHHEVKSSSSHTSEVHEEIRTTTGSDAMWQGASTEDKNFTQQESIGTAAPSINDRDEIEMEEPEGDDQYYEETSYDWFSDIARPRSYWEDKRQAWYQEMLSTSSDNNEIRQLLERKTVSNFLSSDLREKMDQLMVSRAQIQISQADEELDGEDNQGRMGQLLLSFLQRHSHNVAGRGSQEDQREGEVDRGGRGREEEDDEDEDEEEEEYGQEAIREEEEGSANHQYIEATEYFDQTSTSMHSPSPFRSWTCSDQQEEGYDDGSEHASINPMHIPLPSQASNQDAPQCASTGHPSIELELINNLRGHMVQLQREMTELRKSLQACMEMQTKMQCYLLNQQGGVHPASEARNLVDKTPRKRTCCVCYEVPVDSFLYRCGHMCTCLKCANELQWSSGKCPICQAPILDVVRAYRDS